MDVWLKLNSKREGRDAVVRVTQQICRLLKLYCGNTNTEFASSLEILDTKLEDFRLILNFGRSIEYLKQALSAMHIQKIQLRIALSMRSISAGVANAIESASWIYGVLFLHGKLGLMDAQALKFTLFSVFLRMYRCLLEINQHKRYTDVPANQIKKSLHDLMKFSIIETLFSSHCKVIFHSINSFLSYYADVVLELLKCSSDTLSIMGKLKHIRLPKSVQHLAELISSVISLITMINPTLKLTP